MSSSLFLLAGPGIWPDAFATADVGAIYDSGVREWPRMVGPANGSGRYPLRETRQLFHQDRQSGTSPAVTRSSRSTGMGGLAGETSREHPSVSPRQIGSALQPLLLEFTAGRVRHPYPA